MNNIERTKIADGVYFNTINDDRFKKMKMTVNFILPLNANSAPSFALLGGVLTRSCMAYPDFNELNRRLSSLYGAELGFSFSKLGENQLLTFSIMGIDSRYAFESEDSFTDEITGMLYNVLFQPKFVNGKFDPFEIDIERKQLHDLVDSEFSEKRIYANNRMIEIMCKEEAFGVSRYGNIEKIDDITPSSLKQTWKEMLRKAVVEIFFVGSGSTESIKEMISLAFENINRLPLRARTRVVRSASEVKEESETIELAQCKLVMGFRTDCASPEPEVNAARLMCAVLGGTANSKLFLNVREKQSLCYYCSSRYDRRKGIMVVDSGVENDNIEKAKAGILKEIEDMQNGVITDFEIESAKKAIVNSYYSSNDTVSGIEIWYMAQIFDGEFLSIEEMSDQINAVTKEQVIEAAKKLTLDTVFVLKNDTEAE